MDPGPSQMNRADLCGSWIQQDGQGGSAWILDPCGRTGCAAAGPITWAVGWPCMHVVRGEESNLCTLPLWIHSSGSEADRTAAPLLILSAQSATYNACRAWHVTACAWHPTTWAVAPTRRRCARMSGFRGSAKSTYYYYQYHPATMHSTVLCYMTIS